MVKGLTASIARNTRFLVSLVPAFVLLLGFLGVVSAAASRLEGGVGFSISVVAGICLVLGVLLSYHIGVDWLNLRVIRSVRWISSGRTATSGIRDIDGQATGEVTEPCRGGSKSALWAAAWQYVSPAAHRDRSWMR